MSCPSHFKVPVSTMEDLALVAYPTVCGKPGRAAAALSPCAPYTQGQLGPMPAHFAPMPVHGHLAPRSLPVPAHLGPMPKPNPIHGHVAPVPAHLVPMHKAGMTCIAKGAACQPMGGASCCGDMTCVDDPSGDAYSCQNLFDLANM